MREEQRYRVLIVEDEPLECLVLEEILRKRYPQIEKTDTAANGLDALKIVQEYLPDLLLVDINLPVISGLELIKELYRHSFEGEILMVTAYDSFSYAKEAMRYGAAGYLLKPIQDQELYEYMEQCMRKIDKRRDRVLLEEQLSQGISSICSYAQSYLVQDLLRGNVPESALSYAYGYPEDGALQIRMVRMEFGEKLAVERQNEALRIVEELFCPMFQTLSMVGEETSYFLIQPLSRQERGYLDVCTWALAVSALRSISNQITQTKISVTQLCDSYEELQAQIREWIQNTKRERKGTETIGQSTLDFFLVYKSTYFTAHEKKMRRQKAVQRMREGNGSRIVRIYKAYFEKKEDRYEGVYLLMRAWMQYDPECDLADLAMAIDPCHVEESLETWFSERFYAERDGKAESENSPVIRTAIQIIQEEYDSFDLTQAGLAERLGLSQAYFSRLFKKETGKNFVAQIAEIRLGHARELLDSGMAPDQIAEKCGYSNKKYFYDSFRQRFGMTVLQYQKRRGR